MTPAPGSVAYEKYMNNIRARFVRYLKASCKHCGDRPPSIGAVARVLHADKAGLWRFAKLKREMVPETADQLDEYLHERGF